MEIILSAKGIRKSYGHLEVLKSIDLDVERKEVLSIVGPSGAGKSTLLHILGTLDEPDAGHLMLNGKDLIQEKSSQMAEIRNKHFGFIFQFHNLLPEFNALENVSLPGLIAGKKPSAVKERAEELLKRLGLGERLTHKPSALSGGEQQRVAVARALINDPALVLADEPSGNLDSKSAESLHRLFFELRKELGYTFIIVTHNDALAQMSDRIITLKDGLISSS